MEIFVRHCTPEISLIISFIFSEGPHSLNPSEIIFQQGFNCRKLEMIKSHLPYMASSHFCTYVIKNVQYRKLNVKFLASLMPAQNYCQQHFWLDISEVLHFFSGSSSGLLQCEVLSIKSKV